MKTLNEKQKLEVDRLIKLTRDTPNYNNEIISTKSAKDIVRLFFNEIILDKSIPKEVKQIYVLKQDYLNRL